MSSDLTEASCAMRTPSIRMSRHCWAVVLAGGDGTRLQNLTLKIAGDARPKQYCSILGEESLLAQTRARLDSSVTRMPWWSSSHAITTTPTLRHLVKLSDLLSSAPGNIRIRSSSWAPGPTTRKSNTGG